MIYGFEWVKGKDFQRNYSHEEKKENPYTPHPQGSTIIGFEWRKDSDTQQQYAVQEPAIQRTLIYSNGEYKSLDGGGWKTVSSTLPTTDQFQEEGMEDLSILDRQVQPVLDSPIQMSKEDLGEGNLFKASVALKKYFDLRELKIKKILRLERIKN